MGDTFRKFISIVCVLALLTGLVPSAALAAPDGTEAARAAEPVSVTADQKSGEPAADRSGSFSPKTGVYTADSWTKLQDQINFAPSESTIMLTNDAIAGSSDGPLMIPDKQLTINLNGHTISRSLTDPVENGYVISASGHSNHTVTFTGTGTITGGRNTGNGGGIYVNGINLALKDSVSVTGNTAANGGGIYIGGNCTLYLYNSSSVTGNTAANGGGVYIHGFYFEIHDSSSITQNTATSDGGGVYAYAGELRLYGGSISENNSNARSKGIYQTGGSNRTALILPNGSTAKVTDSVYLPTDSIITVEGTPSAEACIHVTTQTTPTPETPLIIATSSASYDCSSNFVIDNPPINSELVYEDPNVRLRVFEVTTWTKLQEALNRGGFLQSDGSRLIQLTQDITAGGTNGALEFNYDENRPVTLDLNGCAINRGLSTRTENGNVLTVSGGTLTIRDSSTEKTGKIKGGDNEGAGGGVCVLGGTLTMEGGSITSNYAASGGGGVYVYGGSFIMEGGSVEDNMARTYGSGIYVIEGSANIKGSVISGNSAGDANLHGGGIFVGGEGSLTIEDSEIKYHRALYGGGVYVAAGGSATMTSGSISGNTATSDGGGIYVAPDGSATINGGSIQSNIAMNNGGGILIESGSLDLKGGTISGNTATRNGKGIYQDGSLTLSEGAELNVTDSVYLPAGKFITVNSIPTEPVHVQLESTATLTNPVVIAHSTTDCRGIFVIDSKQPNTELFYDGTDHAVKLRLTPVVTTWAELQAALNNGGVPETTGEETVNMIRLGGDITAADNESALVFDYTDHSVTLDLNGHDINRNKTSAASNGYVLEVKKGSLNITGSNGSITGGYNENGNNTGYGGGIYMSGGTLTLSGVTVTGNHANYGGGVFVESGTLTMQNSHVNDNTASSNGGGIYVDPNGTLVLGNGSDITINNATSNGGGVYVYKGKIVLSGGSIKNNASQNGGGVYLNAAQMQLSGGTILGNSSYNDNYRGVYPDGNSSLTLSTGSAITADCIYLPANKKLTVAGDPAGGSKIHVVTETAPTPDASVAIADSEVDCRSSFAVDNQPHTRLVWKNNEIRVEYRSTVMTWAELQEELDAGGMEETAGEYVIRLGDYIAAEPDDTALEFNYTDHPVTLDLNGYVINRNLTAPVTNGYVLLVNGGNLRITGNSGSIYGGSNSGTNGGGISINGGSVTLAGDVSIGKENWKEGNSATHGGGVYVGSNGSFTLDGGSIEANSAERGGAVYVNGGSFTMSRGSIRGNIVKDVNANSVIHAAGGSTVVLKGGVIEDNTCTASTIINSKISLVDATLTLSDDPDVAASLVVENSIDLTDGKTITIDAPLEPGDTISILADTPAYGNFVKIADSAYDCTSNLTIENQPYAKLTHESNEIRLRDGRVTTWAELQAALNDGGVPETTGGETVNMIRLGGDITAADNDQALVFNYTGHPVILDLCGYSIDRGLSTSTENGNVLTVSGGTLTIRDSSTEKTGKIKGGYNEGEGGGVRVLGGTLTMEGGSITGNTAKDVNGGGVYVTTGGTFKLKGGSITGNGAFNCKGGGVYVNGGSFIVSGSPSVTGNFDDTQSPSNVYLANNCVISLEGALTDDASIHVAAEQDGPITDASYKTYHDGVVSPAFFTLDGGGQFYLNTEGCLCAERSHHLSEQPEWTWAEDLTNATATMRCQSCGVVLWTETADKVTFEHDEVLSSTLYAAATVTHDNTPYKGRQPMTDRLDHIPEVQPSIDENGTYRSGMREHFVINAGNKTYYFKSIKGHAGEQCKLEDLVWNWFIISATNQNTGIIQKYVDVVSYGTTRIDLPSRIENTVGQETAFVPLKILGDGENAFYTLDISPSASEAHVEITDRASITNVGAASFADRSDLTLNLNTTEAITIAGNAFGNSRNVTINALHVESPITIADGAFTGCENATIRTLHASGLQLGEHDDEKGRYTVEMQDGHSYHATATWAEDYSTADITITCSGCGDTHTFQATNITRTDTETVNPDDTQVKTYTISITAEGSYNGQTYSVTLNPVPYYEVTVQGTEGTLRLPRARNTDNTDFADYAMFTVTQDMLDPLHPPAGAVLDGLTDGSGTYHAGEKVTIKQNTNFSASWRSTWAKVQTALNDSETNLVTLYSDISPAAEGDSYLHIPSGKSVTLNLGNHTVNRGLSGAINDGYVIRVDGALTLSGNNGTVTGGNNTGDGGGIYVGNGGTLETNNVSITHNHAQNGGGVYMLNVSGAEFNNSSITDNTAAQQGGGLYIGGEASQSNGGILGSAPVAEMAVILNSTVVARNTAGMSAGGVYVNKGEMKIGSNTKIINNTKGGDFNNIDVGSGGKISILDGVSGFVLGFPALTSAGITGLPVWAEILIAGGAVALGTVIFDRTKRSDTDDDQERECEHPEESKRGQLKWEENKYTYADEFIWCAKCGRALETPRHEPTITVNETTKVTNYKVSPKYAKSDTSRDVSPYKLIKQANIPTGIDTSKISSELGDKEELIAHKRHEEKTEQLGNSPWTFKTNEGLKFNDWLHGNEKVTSVTFSGNDDNEKITVKVNWQLPYGYTPNDSKEDRAQGDHPLKPDSDANPIYVDKGTEETVKENKWTRKAYSFSTWKQPSSVSIEKEGGEYKLVYSYDDKDKTKKADDKITIDLPVMLRAEWQSKWAALAANLEKDPHSVDMSENVEALSDDKTITVAADNTDTLDLKGKTLDGKSQSGVEHIFDISGTLTVKDSTDEKNGVVKGGKTDKNGAGALVEKTGTLKLESGSIKDNMTVHQDNSDPGHGGGVYVDGDSDHHGSFEMSGGSVKDNKAWHSGGGVYITEQGSFKMSGGEITGNKAGHAESGSGSSDAKGGGVYVGGSFEVSGKVIIKDNKIGDTASNVYLPEGKTITVSGKLDNDARIHVSMQTPGVITSGLNAKGGDNARGKAENFVSDDENYKVIITDAGEAKLVDKNAKPKFEKARLELGGILRMRFYVELPEGWETENDRIDFSLKDMEPLSYAYSKYQTDDEGNYFVCPVNAYQMADTITAKYYHGDEEVATYTYTVEQYLRTLMYPSTNDQTAINLARATANYGHYIQPYLAATNGWTVGEDYAEMKTFEPIQYYGNPDEGESYKYVFNTTQNYSLKVAKTEFYLTLDSDTLLNVRVYLRNSEGTVTGKVGENDLKHWKRAGNSEVICLEGIPANALGTPYTFECFVDGVKVFDLSISALSIVNLALKNGGASDEERMAFTALYNYAMAAKDYTP